MLSPPNRPEGCPSDLALDRYAAEELSARERARVGAHFEACTRCTARRRLQQEQAEAYLATAPSRALAARLRGPDRGWRQRSSLLASALLAAAAMLLGIQVLPDAHPEQTRTKGAAFDFDFVVKRGPRVLEHAADAPLFPGDQLRFVVRAARPGYLAILSRDARAVVSVYHPVRGEDARLPATSGAQPLAASIELDDALGEERLLALFCSDPVPIDALRSELERTSRIAPRAGCLLAEKRFVKEPPAP